MAHRTTWLRSDFELSARSLARFVEIEIPGKDLVFSDNYFDVLPGSDVTVSAPWPDGMAVEVISQAVRVRSLYDSFKEPQ